MNSSSHRSWVLIGGVAISSLLIIFSARFFPSLWSPIVPSNQYYLIYHSVVELVSIIISLQIFILSWLIHKQVKNSRNLLIGVAFLGVAILDIFHFYSFPGMPGLFTAASTHKEIYFWLATRFIALGALLAAGLIPSKKDSRFLRLPFLLGIVLTLVALILGVDVFFGQYVPLFFVEGEGLTPLKIALEYVIIALGLAAVFFYCRQYLQEQENSLLYLTAGIILTIFSELCFTFYGTAVDVYNFWGHNLEFISYGFFFYALFVAEVKQPYLSLNGAYRVIAESEQRRREISALLAGTRAILEHREFQVAARVIFDSCKNLIGAKAGYVALLSKDEVNNDLLFLDAGGLPCSVDPNLPMLIRGLREVVYRTGKAAYDNDFPAGEWMQFMPEGHVRLDNVLFAPLIIEGKAVGLLGLANKPGGVTEEDLRLASAFGELAAIALFNSRTLESLKSSEERHRAITRSANDAIISIDGSGNIISWNRGAQNLFGYDQEEIFGKPLALLIPESYRGAHYRGMNRVLAGGETRITGKTIELQGLMKNGREFPLELSLSVWKKGEDFFFTGIVRDITERKRAEEELKEYRNHLEAMVEKRTEELRAANERLQIEMAERKQKEEAVQKLAALVETSTELIGMATLDAKITYLNPAGRKLVGLGPNEDLTGKVIFDFLLKEDLLKVKEEILPTMMQKGYWEGETRLRHFVTGELIPIHQYSFVIQDEKTKQPIAFANISHDITERQRAEEAQKRFVAILEAAADFVGLADKNGRVLYINKAGRKMLGMNEDEDISNFTIPDSHSQWAGELIMNQGLPAAIRDGVWSGETALLSRQGREIPIWQIIIVHKTPQGEIEFFSTIARDITERKQAEESLLQEKNLSEAIMNSLPGIFYLIDDKGKFLRWNRNYEKITGYTDEEITNMHSLAFVAEEDKKFVLQKMEEVLAKGEASAEVDLLLKNGNKIPFFFTASRVPGTPYIAGTGLDITKRKQVEEELQKLNRALLALSECNRAMMHATTEEGLLHEICRIIVEVGGYRLAWVGFAEEDGARTVRPAAQVGYEEGYLQKIKITWANDPWGSGPMGTAIRTGKPSICRNTFTDPDFALWRDEAAKRGYSSILALPLTIGNGRTFGALGIYAVKPDAFDSEEIRLLAELANDLAYGIMTLRICLEHKRAVEALQKSEAYFRLLAENAQDIIYRYRVVPSFKFEYVSPAAGAITGYTPEEFYADPDLIFKIIHPEDQHLMEIIRQNPASLPTPLLLRLLHKDGRITWIELLQVPIYDEGGNAIAVEGIARDSTQRKEMEEEIINYQEQLRSLASELSLAEERQRRQIAIGLHDHIGAALTVSKMKLEAMMRESASSPDLGGALREIIELIEETIKDVRSLIFDLSPPIFYELDFRAAAEWISEQIQQKYGIAVILEDDRQPKPLNENTRMAIFQALRELLINVAKHAQVREARVSLKSCDDKIQIKVKDEGIGFNPHEVYSQAHKTGSFGLFSVRERLYHLGGYMEVKSEPGRGTEITLTAPLEVSK